jgi:hypothetical protein
VEQSKAFGKEKLRAMRQNQMDLLPCNTEILVRPPNCLMWLIW